MNEMTNLEMQLRSWAPRRPSALAGRVGDGRRMPGPPLLHGAQFCCACEGANGAAPAKTSGLVALATGDCLRQRQ